MMLAGTTHTTMADARAISEAKLVLPSNELESLNQKAANLGTYLFASTTPNANLPGGPPR